MENPNAGIGIDPQFYRACEAVGELMQVWGFKRVHGMVWMYIYLQPEPVSVQQLRDALGISAGLASMTLAELQRWDVIHRRSAPGERKDFFAAEPNIWRPILKVLRDREYYQVGVAIAALKEVHAALLEGKPAGMAAGSLDRLAELVQLGELAHQLFGQFLDLGVLDARDLRQLSLGAGIGKTLLAMKRLVSQEPT